MKNYHEFVIEIIYHFLCIKCSGWWSHAVDSVYRNNQNKSCPHCGEKRKNSKEDIEKIYHFNCGDCNNWWSHVTNKFELGGIMFCPHCGKRKKIIQTDAVTVAKNMGENNGMET